MTNLKSIDLARKARSAPTLFNGDRMKQPEFHRRYEQHPEGAKFELIGGIVYMASPARLPHGHYHIKLGAVLSDYADETPGVQGASEATAILGEESEPQPDLMLRITEECGGQSTMNEDEYLEGSPELIAEVAYSSRAIDLNQKRDDYHQAGVLEYIVLSIEDERVFWFHFPSGGTLGADDKGVLRSVVFPGLWIHEAALLHLNMRRVKAVLRQGLKTKGHRDFVRRLQRQRRKS